MHTASAGARARAARVEASVCIGAHYSLIIFSVHMRVERTQLRARDYKHARVATLTNPPPRALHAWEVLACSFRRVLSSGRLTDTGGAPGTSFDSQFKRGGGGRNSLSLRGGGI